MAHHCWSTLACGLPGLRASPMPSRPTCALATLGVRRRMDGLGLRQRAQFLPWLLVLCIVSAHATSAVEAAAHHAVATEGEAARRRAFSQPTAFAEGRPLALAAGETAAAVQHLPAASCGGSGELGKWVDHSSAQAHPAPSEGVAPSLVELGTTVSSASSGGAASAAELRAAYLEFALRERLLATSRERASKARAGGLKRLRPVSFTLRESHGGRNLSLPPLVPPPESPYSSSLASALSFLRSSLL